MSRLSRALYLFLSPLSFSHSLSLPLCSSRLPFAIAANKNKHTCSGPSPVHCQNVSRQRQRQRKTMPARWADATEAGSGRGEGGRGAVFVKPEKTKCRRHNNSWTADGHINILNMFILPYFVAPQNLQCLPPHTPYPLRHAARWVPSYAWPRTLSMSNFVRLFLSLSLSLLLLKDEFICQLCFCSSFFIP